MPEGPTIHRLAHDHESLFGGRAVRVSSPQGRFADGAAVLDGRVLETVQAWGKHSFHGFEGDRWLHVHLGLIGSWTHGTAPPPAPRGALRVRLENDTSYADLRGPIACELITERERDAVCARLGPDPLRKHADPERAWLRLARSRAPVGGLLMDQSVVAGVGNVFRAEVLYRAGIAPHRLGHDVTRPEWEALWQDLSRLMRSALRAGRIVTTRPDDRPRPGRRPTREESFYVYRRAGLPCRRCGNPVLVEVLQGRNLFWCATCQPR